MLKGSRELVRELRGRYPVSLLCRASPAASTTRQTKLMRLRSSVRYSPYLHSFRTMDRRITAELKPQEGSQTHETEQPSYRADKEAKGHYARGRGLS